MKTVTLPVKLCIGNNVQDVFTSLKRPLDTVKEEVTIQQFKKRGMGFDRYRLVTTKNAMVTDFTSISQFVPIEGQPSLIFHSPEEIVPLSGNEWSNVQLDQLKIVFADVNYVDFFSDSKLTQFEMSARGAKLVEQLSGIDHRLHLRYQPAMDESADQSGRARAIREDPLLQHPICKALFAARTYAPHESFFDDFVKRLLGEMGFNEGSLYAAPQIRMNLSFGDIEKVTSVDFTIIDLLSFTKIGVVEDMRSSSDSTPQLVAAGIAITQRNEEINGRQTYHTPGNTKADSSETVYGIRVTGSLFHFYAMQISSEIHSAMKNRTSAVSPTTMFRYKNSSGLDFMVKQERDEIIFMLSLLQQIAKGRGETKF